jgi:hypothetical protein
VKRRVSHLCAAKAAAQHDQVLWTVEGVGFKPTFSDLSRGFIPAQLNKSPLNESPRFLPHSARLKPLLYSTKSCGLLIDRHPDEFSGSYPLDCYSTETIA